MSNVTTLPATTARRGHDPRPPLPDRASLSDRAADLVRRLDEGAQVCPDCVSRLRSDLAHWEVSA